MTDPDAELDTIVAMLGDAGRIVSYVDDEGQNSMRLTERGAQMGRALAVAGDDAESVLAALLDAAGPGP